MDSNEGLNSSNSDIVTEEDLIHVEDVGDYRSDIPAQIEKHLEFVASNRDGHILLGSSNLTGRYWCGSVWYYLDPFLAPEIEGSKAALEFSSGVTDCVFIDDKRAIVAQDGGLIDYITIKDWNNSLLIERTEQIEDHGYSVVSVKLACNGKTAITASMDMGGYVDHEQGGEHSCNYGDGDDSIRYPVYCHHHISIRLWDCHTTACTHNFTPAHTQEVTSVAPHSNHPEIFLSSSLDGNVLLWDLRSPKPASCVFRDVDDCPSAVGWVPTDSSDSLNYIVGTLSGELHLRSPKVISHSLTSIHPFKRPVFKLTSNKYRHNQIAACANETKVQVFTIEESTVKLSYCDDRHTDFVRGLEWLNEYCLVSCGWDKAVYHHSPTHENQTS